MIWLLTIPIIYYLTFTELMQGIIFAHSDKGFLDWVTLIFFSFFFGSLISLVPFGISALIGTIPKIHGVVDKKYPLIAIKEKDGFTGQLYFLGIGYIKDTQYYFWYRKNENGSISGGKTERTSGVEIYEKEESPTMITFRSEYKNPFAKYIWLIGIDLRCKKQWCDRFIIPKGSVKENYSL